MADIKQIEINNTKYNISGAAIVLEDNSTTTAGTWLAKTSQISALTDGQIFLYKITKAGASTTTLNITGSGGTALGAKTIYRYGTTNLTTQYGVGQYILLTYNSTDTCFRVVNNYDANSTNYVRYDTSSQGLTSTQKSNARTNIGAGTSSLALGTSSTTAAAGNHAHGNITNSGTITSTAVTSATGVLVYDSNNAIQRATAANARTIIGAGTSNLTIGTTGTTAAAGNHTHTISLAANSGTSTIDLAADTKYKLTAGGSSIIFKTPAGGSSLPTEDVHSW